MGKVKAAAKSPQKAAVVIPPEVLAKVNDIRTEAQQQFLKKEYSKASESYDQAVRLLPEGAAEKAELLQKKVGCLINLKKYKEAAKDASTVIELAPNSPGAYKARAKALEQLGLLKQALSDVQFVNKSEASTPETKDMEKRLKDAIAGRGTRPVSAAPKAAANSGNFPQLTIKATYGSESKLLYTSLSVSYADLLDLVKAKFPTAGHVLLRYVDKEGDLVTITSRTDIQVALTDLVNAFQRQFQGPQAAKMLQQHGLPPLKVMVVPVASAAEVPKPPAAELAEKGIAVREAAPAEYQAEEWLLEFARLFSDVTGLDPNATAEHYQAANEKMQRAMTETVHSEEADALFDMIGDHHRDAVVASYIQWGNVHIMKADRKLHEVRKAAIAANDKNWMDGKGLEAVLQQYDLTEAKVQQALAVHAESWEAMGSLAQVEWERAKAKMGYVVPPPVSADEGLSPEEQQAAASKQVVEVLSGITKERVEKVKSHVDKCNQLFEQALVLANKAHAAKQAREAARKAKEEAASGATPAPAEEAANGTAIPMGSAPSNVLIMHGNIMYDWSQVLAATGADSWRPVLDAAAVKFRESGAPEADVRVALKNHTRKDELDLGPDPEPEAPATPAQAPVERKPAPEAKGLPSLELKKPKK